MTIEEAIEILDCYDMDYVYSKEYSHKFNEARNMVIKAVEQKPCDDVVSRQAVLDIVCGVYEKVGFGWGESNFYKAIQELPSVRPQEPKWIPVSERLPEKDRKYNAFLVTDSEGNLSISKFYLPLSNSDIDRPYWSGMIDVIAWMPLPKPYEPQESEV